MSSAKREIEDIIFFQMPFTYTRKSKEPSTEKCGTPKSIRKISDLAFEIRIIWNLLFD